MVMMTTNILMVGAGGFFGAVCRYLMTLPFKPAEGTFPTATFIVNISGCLALGLISGRLSAPQHLLFGTGFLGAYTTFSAFSMETYALFSQGRLTLGILYAGLSVLVGLLAASLGFHLSKFY